MSEIYNVYGRTLAAWGAAKRSPILIYERQANPLIDFLMFIMASGIAPGCIHTTATTTVTEELPKMVAMLQLIGWKRHSALVYNDSFIDIGHPCYGQLTPVKTRYPLTNITWPYRRLIAHLCHMVFRSWPLIKSWFSIGSWAHVMIRLTCKRGQWVNSNPVVYKCFSLLLFCVVS